jgi:hypothetical protein
MEGSSSRDYAGQLVSGIVDVAHVADPELEPAVSARARPLRHVDRVIREGLLFDDGERSRVGALPSGLTELSAEISSVIFTVYGPMAQLIVPASLQPQQG